MTFLKVMAFSLVVLLSYTLFANMLPQVQSDPPAEETVSLDTMDRAGQIAWGERLFVGRGTCALCHNNLGRAPDLLELDLAATFDARLADPDYQGAATGLDGTLAVEAYLRESLIAPSVYVVPGFGKKGTNDTVSPMPATDGPPISLAAAETDAVIAFLQDRGGYEVTVSLPADDDDTVASAEEPVDDAEEDAVATTPEAVIEKFACAGCHDLDGSEADVGPRLGGIGDRMTPAQLRTAILDPNAEIPEGFDPDFMPQDYGEQMRAAELELLVAHLMTLPADENE